MPRRAWSVRARASGRRVVGPTRFELVTSRLSSVRSNQLSYGPIGRIDQIPSSWPKANLNGTRSWARDRLDNLIGYQGVERETKTAAIRSSVYFRRLNKPKLGETVLRKEVIQPQVPLRLPCYDFTPVADPTVVAYLPYGLAQRLRVEPTPMV